METGERLKGNEPGINTIVHGLFLMGGHSKEGADRFTCSMDKISTTNHQCVNEMEI